MKLEINKIYEASLNSDYLRGFRNCYYIFKVIKTHEFSEGIYKIKVLAKNDVSNHNWGNVGGTYEWSFGQHHIIKEL